MPARTARSCRLPAIAVPGKRQTARCVRSQPASREDHAAIAFDQRLPIHVSAAGRRTAPQDALTRRALFLHTVLAVCLGAELTAGERAVLDTALITTYANAGITTDPRTWTRPAPLMRDLRDVLATTGDEITAGLAARLHPFVDGAFADLFSGPTTTAPDGHLVVFSLRDLPDELKAIGALLTLDAIWRRVSNPVGRRRRLVVVDEASLLMQSSDGARFLYRMSKTFRKHWAGLTVATQDIDDVLSSELGRAIVANAATSVLLRQSPQAIDQIAATFNLSEGQRQFLLTADRGQGPLGSGTEWVVFQALASPTEDTLVTTDPKFLSTLQDADANPEWVEL